VHDEEQDELFVSEPKALLAQSEQTKTEGPLNPFEDNLANSERLPTKLDVLIQDNYISQISNHKENMAKRKKRGQNLSIHQFDEATQKCIQDTVAQER
jgi:hypothetical protein